jgi:hypothetical protein
LGTASFLPVDAAFKCPGKRNGDLYRAVAVIALADIDKTRIPNLLPLREIYAIMSHYRSYLALAGGGVILALIPTPVTEGLQSEKSYSCLFL